MGKIKIAIVGLNFGRWIIKQLQTKPGSDFFELAAVCDMNVAKADSFAAKLGVKAYYSLDDLLVDSDIPAIGLYTAPAGRAQLLRKLIHAGKDVMSTKPCEVDAEQALAVLREAKSMGRVIHLNSPAPTLPPDLAQIKQWVAAHHLGRPIAGRMETWASYREKPDGGWYDDPDKCPVAPIFRLGIYLINDLVELFGEPKAVQVMHSRIFTERPTPDNAQLGITFANGAIAGVFASFCVGDGQHYTNSATLNYENGTIYRNVGPVTDGKVQLTLITKNPDGARLIETASMTQRSGDYQWDVFHSAINGVKPAHETTPETIAMGIKIIQAMNRAQKSGNIESV